MINIIFHCIARKEIIHCKLRQYNLWNHICIIYFDSQIENQVNIAFKKENKMTLISLNEQFILYICSLFRISLNKNKELEWPRHSLYCF